MDNSFSAVLYKNIKTTIDEKNIPLLKKIVLEEHVKLRLIGNPELMYEILTVLIVDAEKKRGRPKKEGISKIDVEKKYLNMACKIKAYLTDGSFTVLWEECLPSIARPTQTKLSVFECASALRDANSKYDPFEGKDTRDNDSLRSGKAWRKFGLKSIEIDAINWFKDNVKEIDIATFIDLYDYGYFYQGYSDTFYRKHIDGKNFTFYACVNERLLCNFEVFETTILKLINGQFYIP